jgi:DNA-binding IclR family transcriptional regulator
MGGGLALAASERGPRPGGSERVLALLGLFSEARPAWTVEEIAEALGIGLSTAYRLVGTLTETGWLHATSPGRYGLGPAVIRADRLARRSDPLLRVAGPVMQRLAEQLPPGSTLVLARLFGDHVMCVEQLSTPGPQPPISYERGRPMPLFRGAAGKALLGHLSPARLRRLHAAHAAAIADGRLGQDLAEFLAACARIRRDGYAMTVGEVDPGRCGIGAPVLSPERRLLGSLGAALSDQVQPTKLCASRAAIIAAARELSDGLGEAEARLAETA